MKVYVLLKGYAHEGYRVLGVYSSFDLAHSYAGKVAAEEEFKEDKVYQRWNDKYGNAWLEINEWDVISD